MHETVSCGVQTASAQTGVSDAAEDQVRLYLAQPNIPLSESPTTWWQDNACLYPQVAGVAQRWVCRPPLYRASSCSTQSGSCTRIDTTVCCLSARRCYYLSRTTLNLCDAQEMNFKNFCSLWHVLWRSYKFCIAHFVFCSLFFIVVTSHDWWRFFN